jgi:hypothetical protein
MPKALAWFNQQIEHKLQGNLTENSALVNSDPAPWFEIYTTLHSKLAMPLNREVVCLDKLHISPIGWFLERAKVLEWHKGVKGDNRVLSSGFDQGLA